MKLENLWQFLYSWQILYNLPIQQFYTHLHTDYSWHNTIVNRLPLENDKINWLFWNDKRNITARNKYEHAITRPPNITNITLLPVNLSPMYSLFIRSHPYIFQDSSLPFT